MQEAMRSVASVCPGQGSQSVGMLNELAAISGAVRTTLEEASDAIGLDLWKLVNEGPEDQLNLTENTQPALVAASVAVWRVVQERQAFLPAYFAGHSLGEYSALCMAGALTLADAVKIVRERGRLMSQALEPGIGGMVAVLGLDEAPLRAICEEISQSGQVVSLANINAPGQIVLAGHLAALEKAAEACKAAGAKRAVSLPVSGPFHSQLIKDAGEGLATVLESVNIQAPIVPVVQNVSNQPETDPAQIKRQLVQQVTHPVNWVGAVQSLQALGAKHLVEVGPGKVLSGLNKRIDKALELSSTETPAAVEKFMGSLGA